MKYNDEFPVTMLLNLSFRNDRRINVQTQCQSLGIEPIRSPGIFSSRVKNTYGYFKKSRYACSLAKRMALRKAKILHSPTAVLLEDDVIFHHEFHHILSQIDLPADWGIFFFGCKHLNPPLQIGKNLFRVSRASDNHAMAINMKYYGDIIKGLGGGPRKSAPFIRFSDVKLSDCQRTIPTYAAYPNLIWQAPSYSDGAQSFQSNYSPSGQQLCNFL